jgi:hypothetical protein
MQTVGAAGILACGIAARNSSKLRLLAVMRAGTESQRRVAES